MSRKKGMSPEEKAAKVEEFLREKAIPYTAKELEVLVAREKGVLSQSVVEVLTQLTSEGRVMTAKVGVHTLFWAFPATRSQNLLSRRAALEVSLAALQQTQQSLESNQAALEVRLGKGRDAAGKYQALESKIHELKEEKAELEKTLADNAACDPAVVEELQALAERCVAAANRWTDNVFLVEEYVSKRLSVSRSDMRKSFSIPMNFEFITLEKGASGPQLAH